MGRFGLTEVTHVFQIRIDVEGTPRQVKVLTDAQSATGTEHLLLAIHVHIRIGVITLGDVTVVLGRHQIQGQTRQTVGLVGTVFPISGQVHVLVSESGQGTVIGQFDGALQIEFDWLLRFTDEGNQTQTYIDTNKFPFHAFHVYDK